jgi:hypothetical protein
MSGFSSVTPNGYQAVSNYPAMGGFGGYGGYGMGGMGTGFGMDALLILLLLGGQNGGGMWGNRGGNCGGPATTAVATDIVMQPAFQSLQNQITNLQENISSDLITGKIGDLSHQLCASGQNINNTNNANTRELAGSIANLQTAQAAGNFTTLQSINGLQSALTQAATQNLIQGINMNQTTNGLITNGFNHSDLQTLTGFTGVQKTLCDISREMERCCCDMKSTVRDSIDVNNGNTQKILDAMNNRAYADLLEKYNAVQAQNSNLIQTNILKDNNAAQTATILQHLAPFCYQTGNSHGNSSRV